MLKLSTLRFTEKFSAKFFNSSTWKFQVETISGWYMAKQLKQILKFFEFSNSNTGLDSSDSNTSEQGVSLQWDYRQIESVKANSVFALGAVKDNCHEATHADCSSNGSGTWNSIRKSQMHLTFQRPLLCVNVVSERLLLDTLKQVNSLAKFAN